MLKIFHNRREVISRNISIQWQIRDFPFGAPTHWGAQTSDAGAKTKDLGTVEGGMHQTRSLRSANGILQYIKTNTKSYLENK